MSGGLEDNTTAAASKRYITVLWALGEGSGDEGFFSGNGLRSSCGWYCILVCMLARFHNA